MVAKGQYSQKYVVLINLILIGLQSSFIYKGGKTINLFLIVNSRFKFFEKIIDFSVEDEKNKNL